MAKRIPALTGLSLSLPPGVGPRAMNSPDPHLPRWPRAIAQVWPEEAMLQHIPGVQ